jgi:mono/diheme cytochrome c family protein
MRKLVFIPIALLLIAVACDTNSTNPGHHTAEEIASAKPKPVTKPVPSVQTSAGPVDGAQLYAENCGTCHRDGANGAPPLYGIMHRREFPSGTPSTPARLKDTIRMGRANMPGFANTLNDQQIDAIVQYVGTLE